MTARRTTLLMLSTVGWWGAACNAGPIDIVDDKPLLRGLVAHWAMDESSGTAVSDSSGHHHDGAVVGGTWTTGKFGNALQLDQSINELSAVTVMPFPSAMKSFTLALWVKPAAGDFGPGYVTLVSTEKANAGGWEMNMKLTPSESFFQFAYFVGPGPSSYFINNCYCVTPETWTHIAGVVDGDTGTMAFYSDAHRLATPAMPPMSGIIAPIKPGIQTLYMGRWDLPGRLFKGALDDVVIYDRALSGDEIDSLFGAPAPNPPPI